MLLEPTVLDPSEIQDVSSAPQSQPVPLNEDDIATESLRDPKAIVRRYATEAGLDPDLVHRLATQESGYNQNAISPKGAIGVMQLMPATAVRLGVNAYNLHQNIQGGVAELKRLVGKYGDVRKALAAYNAGEGAVDKYGGIPPYAETQNYVNTIAGQKPKPVPLDPSQIGSVQQPVALDENDIASVETPKAAPVVNVGAPGRNVGPAMTPEQLAAAEPWRKPTPNVPSYQQVTPEQADKGIARGAYQDRSLRTVYENLALNADVQKAFQQHAPRLAELEAKQKAAEDAAATPHGFEYQQPLTGPENRELASLRQERVNAQEAWQKQVEPQRQDDLISVAKAKWPANDAALAAFVQKHGPLTRDEQKLLGLPTNYLAQLPINIGAGLAQLGLGTAAGFERFVGSPANARDLEKLSGQVNMAEGVFGNQEVPGAIAHAAGGLLPQFALSAALPEFAPALAATGVIDPALFFGTSALEHYGQGASGEESLKAGVESLLPIAGAKFIGALAVGGPVLQMAQRIGGNAFANGLYTAANNGDSKAIATSFLMGGFMGFGHGESMDVPDDMIRAVITNPDIQSGVADILAKPKLFKQAIPKVEAKLKEAGLTDEQASQFTANLKTAAASSPEGLAKESQNASNLRESEGRVSGQGAVTGRGEGNGGQDNNVQGATSSQAAVNAGRGEGPTGENVVQQNEGQQVLKQPWQMTRSEFENPRQRTSSRDPVPPVSQTYYHGTNAEGLSHDAFRNINESVNTTTVGDVPATRHGIFLADSPEFAREYGKNVLPLKVNVKSTADVADLRREFVESLDAHGPDRNLRIWADNLPHEWQMFEGELGERFIKFLKDEGYDSAAFNETATTGQFSDEQTREVEGNTLVVFDKNQISSGDHRVIVEKALREGKPVPPEVLADYPDLQTKGASVKAFITRADEAELRNRGYSEDQIYKMKPDEAQRILSNPVEPVNEFEAPPKVSTGPVQNKSILEAVRALGRIQVDDDTVEGGELRQFGNKEQKGQGLIGPNGKLHPDLMRERLEEAGFRDPNSLEEPGTPGSLSLDGMYELMDREQRGDKVYSAHRDSNLVDADLAKEYEQYRESGNEDAQFGHESGLEDEWRNPDSPLRQAYERIISGDDANGDEFVSVAQQYGISPESIEEHIQRATRTRESLPPVEVTPGGNDGRPEVAPEEGRITGTKNAVTDAERAERNLSPIEKDIYDEFPKVFDDVKRGIDSGKIDIRGLTREWAEHPKGLSENEEAALIYDRARLYNNKEEIIDEITSAIASGDKAAEIEARVRLAPIEDAIVANEKAAVRSGTIWGRSGAMRQRMMKADYSLANIERRYRAKTGDSPTAEQSANFKKLSEDLQDAQRAIAKRDDIISDLEARRWAKTEARKEAASGRRVKRAGSLDAIKKEWDGQKDALVRLLKLQGIGEPPAGGSKGLGGPEAGAVDPNLVTLPADVAKLLIEMARNRIRAGVTDAVDIVDSIHESIKDKFSVSARQISDAISGYGKQSKLSTDEVEVQLREVKRIRRLMSALEDAQKGEAPQRSGLKRDKPTRLVRELTRQVNEALRKNGYKLESADRSPEEQYQSALDGVKTRLRNQIQDLNERIATGRKPEARTPIQRDAEAMALAKERDGLVATLKEIDGPRRMTNEQRVAATEKALEKSIADYDARINEKRFTPDGKPEPATSPRIEQLRARRDALKKDFDKLKETDPAAMAAKEASALKTYHKQLATREVEMTKTLADIKAGTYEPRAKRTQRNDPVSVEARARAGRIQDEIEKELLKAQLAKRNWTDKALDFAVKWRRNMLLSNPLTLAKLATAAASRVVVSPVEEAVGGIISHLPIASKIAAKAPREGGFSVAAEAKAIYGYTRQLMQFSEAREIVKTGKTRLDTIYGAKGDLPPEAIEFFGRLHKLMKAPAQAAEFARSYQKRVEWALNNKMDPTDPVTQATLASSAYLDAQRAILMQDNAAVTYYRQVISRMRALDSTGKAAHPGYVRALEMLLPIVKVPTNFVTETANYSLGLANALLKFRRAGWDANKLTPDEADSIMRSLKKQFVGQALFWMGYGFADKVGGYYQQGEKRKESAPKAGEVQLFGRNIPHFFLHSPAMEVMQLGATFRHVMDAHADYSTLGKLGSGALAGAAGLSQQVPFIETPATIADAAKSDRKFGKFTANTVGGMFIPPVAKKIAEFQDSGVKRKPGTMGEDIEMMIPATRFNQGLSRKAVPTEEQRKDEQKQKRLDKRMNPDVDKIYENRMKRKGLSP